MSVYASDFKPFSLISSYTGGSSEIHRMNSGADHSCDKGPLGSWKPVTIFLPVGSDCCTAYSHLGGRFYV